MNTYGTTIKTEYLGKREGEWPHFEWRVALSREGVTDLVIPDYKMGVGHAQSKCGKDWPQHHRYRGPAPCGHVRCDNAGPQPKPPDLYDVITSLKSDDTQGEPFDEWAPSLGYDTDSRKALEIYLACQEQTVKAQRFFLADWWAILDDEDYT